MSLSVTSRSELAAHLFPSSVLRSLIRLNWMPAKVILDELKQSSILAVRRQLDSTIMSERGPSAHQHTWRGPVDRDGDLSAIRYIRAFEIETVSKYPLLRKVPIHLRTESAVRSPSSYTNQHERSRACDSPDASPERHSGEQSDFGTR